MKKVFSLMLIVLFVSASMTVFAQDQSSTSSTAAQGAATDQSSTTSSSDQATASTAAPAMPADQSSTTSSAADQSSTTSSSAQDQTGQSLGAGDTTQQAAGNLFVSDNLIRLALALNQNVMNAQGQAGGTISDVVLSADGNVEYVMVNLQGAQSGSYLVPMSSFSVQNQQISLNAQDTSGFQQASAYNQTVKKDSVRLSQLLQFKATGGQIDQGKVMDVVADLSNGKIQYVVFSPSASLGAGGNLLAVPYENVWYNKTDKTVKITAQQNQIVTFAANNWPTTLGASALGSGGASETTTTTEGAAGTTGTESTQSSETTSTAATEESTTSSSGTAESTTTSSEAAGGAMSSDTGSTTSTSGSATY